MGCCSSQVQPDIGELPDGVEQLKRSPADSKAASMALLRSFAGTESCQPELGFDWCLGPELQGKGWDDPRRQNSMAWTFRYIVQDAFSSSEAGVLACRTTGGEFAGVLTLKIYRKPFKDGINMTALMRCGSVEKDGQPYIQGPRMKAMESAQAKLHETHGTEPHLHIAAIGVDPSAQGTGVGGKLMRAALQVADRQGIACYIECVGVSSKGFYEKFGFESKGQEMMTTKPAKGAVVEVLEEHPVFGMWRPAKMQQPSQ